VAEPIVGIVPFLARRPGISGTWHRTASCSPGKLAILSGDARPTFAGPQAAARTAAGTVMAGKR
jgi:hypothetical protein